MSSDPLQILEEVADVLPAESWMLIGGLMVHCHAARAGFTHARSTTDVDIVVQIHAISYIQAAAMSTSGPNKLRHLQDAVTLFACLSLGGRRIIKKSMRLNINKLINALGSAEAWSAAPPEVRPQALSGIRSIRPAWQAPWEKSHGRYRRDNR